MTRSQCAVLWCLALPYGQESSQEGVRFGLAVSNLDDLDRDGVDDFVVSAPAANDESGRLLIYSGKDLSLLRTIDAPPGMRYLGSHLEAVADQDEDGLQEIFATSCESELLAAVLSPADGHLVRPIPLPELDWVPRSGRPWMPAGDSDLDGLPDTAVPSTSRLQVFGRESQLLYEYPTVLLGTAVGGVGDLDQDGTWDWVFALPDGQYGVRSSRDRKTLFELPIGQPPERYVRAWPLSDLDEDGTPDFLVVDAEGFVAYAVSGKSAILLHTFRPNLAEGMKSARYVDLGRCVLAVGDLDGDETPDYLISTPGNSFGSRVFAVSGRSGEAVWAHLGSLGSPVGVSMALLPDRNGDQIPEVLVGGTDYRMHGAIHREGNIRILSGKDGKMLWKLGVDEVQGL